MTTFAAQVADGVQGPPGGSGRRAGGNAAAIAAVGASGDVQPGAATWRLSAWASQAAEAVVNGKGSLEQLLPRPA
eukprot:jgi/Mesen1/5946/ME000301S05076